MNTIVLEPDGRGSFTFTFSSPRGEMSGRVNVGTEGPPDRRSTADKKELVGLIDGVRESAQSWKGLLLDLKRRGLSMPPELAVADGALGFWQAIEEVWPKTRGQRCWVHKTANVLHKPPKSQQSKAKRTLQEIWMAETKKDALAAFDAFIENWGVKRSSAWSRIGTHCWRRLSAPRLRAF